MTRVGVDLHAAHLAIARARLERWLGVDLRRGGLARNLERHVAARVTALGDPPPERWAALLDAEGSGERRALIEATTVPHSWLWRDAPQLAALGRVLAGRGRSRLRVWVPGCASGEDAYTIAALALRAGDHPFVLGTDVNAAALERARLARWSAWSARELPAFARQWFPDDGSGGARASDELRTRVELAERSLLELPPKSDDRGWDLIVCRNVLIYFDRDTARRVVDRLAGALAPAGLLVLGASDVLAEVPPGMAPAGAAGRLVLVRNDAPRAPFAATVPVARPAAVAWTEAPRAEAVGPERTHATAPSAAPAGPTLAEIASVDAERGLVEAEARIVADAADAEAQLVAGILLHARGAHADALARLRAATCVAPGAWAGWLYLGLASERLGRWDEARRAFRRATEAHGEGEDLPRGGGELAETLRAARAGLLDVARRRADALGDEPRIVGGRR